MQILIHAKIHASSQVVRTYEVVRLSFTLAVRLISSARCSTCIHACHGPQYFSFVSRSADKFIKNSLKLVNIFQDLKL